MALVNTVETVKGALREMLASAREDIEHHGGPRGFPAALALFSVIDTIGSYHRGHPTFTVPIDGAEHPIRARRARDHIRILNSPYFRQRLSMAQITEVYALARSPITHNATLGTGLWLWAGEPAREPIEPKPDGIHIYLPGLLMLCETAVAQFEKVAEELIPNSLAFKELQEKATPNETYEEQVRRLAAQLRISDPGYSIAVTAVDSGRRRPFRSE